MNIKAQRHIVRADPGYVRTLDDGSYVLRRDEGEITMTPEEYEAEHPLTPQEEFYWLVDTTMSAISGTQITASAEMIDVLLDARTLLDAEVARRQEAWRMFMDLHRRDSETIARYRERFGEIEIGEEVGA